MDKNNLCDLCKEQPASHFFTAKINDSELSNRKLCTKCKALEDAKNRDSSPINSLFTNLSSMFGGSDGSENPILSSFTNNNGSVLNKFTINLNELALNNKIDPIIGRSKEIEQAILILNRRIKNNPVLIGEPGVGKTAIAQGIAQKIVEGSVPSNLRNKIILSLNTSDLVAGTSFRGQFEERVKSIINEVKKDGNIILFIDELHTIMGAGSVSDSKNDLANMLKPALANGDIQVIGATTSKEFDIIEKDGAMDRRFQKIVVEEPSIEDTIEILKGIKHLYEKHHNISYSDEIIGAITNLANRFIFYRNMPDKAIDLLDTVGSLVNIKNLNEFEAVSKTDEFINLKKAEHEAYLKGDFKNAFEYNLQQEKLLNKNNDNSSKKEISLEDIKITVEKLTGIVVQDVDAEGKTSLINVNETLANRVVGQNKAVDTVAKALKRHRINLRKTKKPTSFLFTGPTGVGKTELAKTISDIIFKNPKAFIRFDMSEYMEEHSVAKFIGSPPGYIGHEDGGLLTNAVKNNPYSLILFDEIEKAHPKVFNIFLQILDEGFLTDAKGKKVDFSNTIIIFTSNVGSGSIKHTGFFKDSSEESVNAVKNFFRPELVNRIDSIIGFNNLSQDSLDAIFEKLLQPIITNVSEDYEISIDVSKDVKKFVIDKGYSHTYGARFLDRTITEQIEDIITNYLLENENYRNIVLAMNDSNDGVIVIEENRENIELKDFVELEKEES